MLGGRFEVESLLGRGGRGTVYAASDLALGGRRVALKLIHRHLVADRTQVERFRREARVLAQVNHRNVVVLYDFGILGNGCPYMVMELLAGGETLEDWILRRGPLPIAHACKVVSRLLSALSAVHAAGVVHRDVKPGNVFVPLPDLSGTKLLDFGLGRPLEPRSRLTASGVRVGTPMYMAPEQIRSTCVDERADIYAVGVLLYEALAGVPPFDTGGQTLWQHMLHVLQSSPPPLRGLRPEVPELLERFVMRALAKDPRQRFPSASEMRRALKPLRREFHDPGARP